MTFLEFSRKEWEELTGADESENFKYRVYDEDDGAVEHEVKNDDETKIRVFVDEEEGIMEVSSHAFVPCLVQGHGIFQNPDGWGELNEWRIDGEWFTETLADLKANGYETV